MKPQRPSDYPWPVTAHHASFIEDFNNAMDSRPITPTTASDSAVSTPTATPTVAEAIEYARNLPADCHADRCIIVPATELARLRAELAVAENWVEHHSKHADDLIGENVKLRAEVERLKGLASWAHTCIHHTDAERKAWVACPCCANARAERAEAALAARDAEYMRGGKMLAESAAGWQARAEKAEAEVANAVDGVIDGGSIPDTLLVIHIPRSPVGYRVGQPVKVILPAIDAAMKEEIK